jgi:phosphoglycolate phosphatase
LTPKTLKAKLKNTSRQSRYLIFDFDGTIADTIGLAIATYNRIAPEYKTVAVRPEDRVLLLSKNPRELMKIYGVTTLKLFFLVLRMRKEFGRQLPEIKPIKNMENSLREIKNAGFKLGIITSNSRKNAGNFLKKNNLSGLFDFIWSGSNLFGKDRIIKRLLHREHIPKENAIYVGDETRDVEAAKKAGIHSIAVSWGLANRDILNAVQPDQIVDDPEDLLLAAQWIFRP